MRADDPAESFDSDSTPIPLQVLSIDGRLHGSNKAGWQKAMQQSVSTSSDHIYSTDAIPRAALRPHVVAVDIAGPLHRYGGRARPDTFKDWLVRLLRNVVKPFNGMKTRSLI